MSRADSKISEEAAQFIFQESPSTTIGLWIADNLETLTLSNRLSYTAIDGLGTLATQSGTFSGTSSGTNTGDQDLSGYATTASLSGYAPTSRTVNGQALSSDVTITTITGNAGTATALQTARTINGESFDGTANIVITAAANGGNADTVTTNANLTGVVTSVGNATAIADGALSIAKTSGLQSALDVAGGPVAIVTESTTGRTMALTDINKYVRLTNASSCTITVPPNSTVAWASQARPPVLYFRIAAAGIPTLAGSGVTFNGSAKVAAMAQHDTFALQWAASDVWDVI